jgi:hypothetical protein
MKRISIFATTIFSILFFTAGAFGQCVSLTTLGAASTQNFDTLSNTAGSTTNNLTITGWFMTETGGGARDNEQYAVDTGASTTGDTYSYGAAAATERALGALRSGTLIPNFGSCFTNNTGATISSLGVAFTGEEWRLGTAGRTDQLNFEYSTNATDLVTGTWTNVAALNFVTPDTVTAGAKNGNAAADRTALSSTIPALSIANGATFWVRWTDIDATGADDGLAIDDFSLTPQGAPPLPNLSIDDVTLAEGNSGTTNFTFTVNLSAAAPAGGVTFDIATADGTATIVDSDYVVNSLTGQTITAGNTSYSFNVLVNGDTSVEPNETFFVNITNITGANGTDTQGQGTITNEDVDPIFVEFESSNYFDDESQTMEVVVERTGDTSGMTSVDYSTQAPLPDGESPPATGGASCTTGVDFIHTSGTLTFETQQVFATFTVQLCGDLMLENDELFRVYLSNVVNGNLGKNSIADAFINDTANQYFNTEPISIGTGGDSYDSSIGVKGAPSSISGLRVTLYDFQHLNSNDIDVLLVGPQGQKYLLMADAGGSGGLTEGATITFEDAAFFLPFSEQIFTGKYKPTTWEDGQGSFPAPAPEGPYLEAGHPKGTIVTLSEAFGGTNPNGTWTLYIRDDDGDGFQKLGADGAVGGGWGLQFFAPSAANASVSGMVRSGKNPIARATVMITGGSLTEPRITKTNTFGNYTFDGLAVGETYVVTVVSNRYNFPQSSLVLNVTDNVVGADFEAEVR